MGGGALKCEILEMESGKFQLIDGISLQALVSVSTIGTYDSLSDSELEKEVKAELAGWFGGAVQDWKLLRNYRIPFAQPNQVSTDAGWPQVPVLSLLNLQLKPFPKLQPIQDAIPRHIVKTYLRG